MHPLPAQSGPSGTLTSLANNSVTDSESKNRTFFIHRTVGFWLINPQLSKLLSNISCHQDHLMSGILQCEKGHLLCRRCHPEPTHNLPNTFAPCPKDGTAVNHDLWKSLELSSLKTTCPSNTTFANKPANTCVWRGLFEHLGNHLDQCPHIPIETRVTIQGELIKKMKQEQDNINCKIDQLTQKMDRVCNLLSHPDESSQTATMRSVERRINHFEEYVVSKLVVMEERIENILISPPVPCNGVMLWKIDNYQCKWDRARSADEISFYSRPFFSDPCGYKMCIRFFPNGDGPGRGTHVSVFIVLMKGDFDALLEWPFKRKVTFMLLDQNNIEHAIDAFTPDPASSSFQRPRRSTNIASGCPLFLSHHDLSTHEYLYDDTLFLKVMVASN